MEKCNTAEEARRTLTAEVIEQLPYDMELVRLANGQELVRFPEDITLDFFPVVEKPREHGHRVRLERETRRGKRRATWSEKGKVPPWNTHEN